MIIKTWRDPYEAGFSPTKPREIEIKEGITVLVGCNGAGKSTLLHNIKDVATEQHIPCHMYDNLQSGGYTEIFGSILGGYAEEGDDYGLAAEAFSSSEGECIKLNIARQTRLYKSFLETGYYKDRKYRFSKVFSDKEDLEIETKQRILLFDAIDSGLSVDSVVEINLLFDAIIKDAKKKGIELYIITAANEYELARGRDCFDVNLGKYIRFESYEDYRNQIIKSRALKEERIKKQIVWAEKQREKKLVKLEKLKAELAAFKTKIGDRPRKWSEEDKIRDLQNNIRTLSREVGIKYEETKLSDLQNNIRTLSREAEYNA